MGPLFFMQRLLNLYRFLNILSLDIVAGAVISALFFAELLNVRILPYGLFALALTVWIIYTADHLRDAIFIGHQASSRRHRFHQQYFKPLIMALGMATVTDSIIIFFMRKPVFEWGLMLAVIVILYLIVQQYLRVLKELFVAILYACGVLLPSLAITSLELNHIHAILIVQFVLIAWINLLIFSWFDYEQDLADKQISFATISGKRLTTGLIWGLSIIQVLGSFLYWKKALYHMPAVLFGLMNVVLLLVFWRFNRSGKDDLFRMLGDAVFFIPGIYLLWISL
jgi:hypothetical protein